MTGANWTSFGNGGGPGQFSSPSGVWIDTAGLIYVADMANDRITRMSDMLGTGWAVLGGVLGEGVDQFINPYAACVDSSGTIYVADSQSGRIVRADDMTGLGWTTYGTEGIGQNNFMIPMGIVVGRRMAAPASAPNSLSLLSSSPVRFAPNPFSGSSAISFEVPAGGATARLRIYDAAGRLERVLGGGALPAGAGRMVWDGRDEGGRAVGSGVFFYRLDVGSRSTGGRVLLTR